MSRFRVTAMIFGTAALLASPLAAGAKTYPTNICVGRKQEDAGDLLSPRAESAWARWERDRRRRRRDNKIERPRPISARLGQSRRQVREAASTAPTRRRDHALTVVVDSAAGAIVAAVNAGLDLGTRHDASAVPAPPGGRRKCARLLGAERGLGAQPREGSERRKRARRGRARAAATFTDAFDRQRRKGCPTGATATGSKTQVDGLVAGVVTEHDRVAQRRRHAVHDDLADRHDEYSGKTSPRTASTGTPYHFFVKRGSVNKLLMYYQGGGACWDALTCCVPGLRHDRRRRGDNPQHATTGFADLERPAQSVPGLEHRLRVVLQLRRPLRRRRAGLRDPLHVEHRGYQNSRIAEKWAREHFVEPGGGLRHRLERRRLRRLVQRAAAQRVWPASQFQVLADAGNGVITADVPADTYFPQLELRGEHPEDHPRRARVDHERHGHRRLHEGGRRATSRRRAGRTTRPRTTAAAAGRPASTTSC